MHPLPGKVANVDLTRVRFCGLERHGETEADTAAISASLLERTEQLVDTSRW
jgi:hypothetical protein